MPHNRKKAKEQGYSQGSGLWINPDTDNGDKEGHIKDYSISSCWISYSQYIKEYADFKPGDVLYVRETWCKNANFEEYYYAANRKREVGAPYKLKWHPSIHMPREAARIWLKVSDVRVERLQDIDDEGVKAEGANWRNGKHVGFEEKMKRSAIDRFKEIWNSTIKPSDRNRYGWGANPWVWVIEFEQCEKPENY